MKKRLFLHLGLLSCLSLLVISCSKQRTEEPELNTYSYPQKFMFDNRPEEQTFVLTGDSAGPIIGNQGTHLWLDSTIFMFPGGGDVPYPIVIKLIEIYTAKDMMLYEMPTVAQGAPLGSDGEIRVKAFKDGVELQLKPDRVFPVRMPADDPNPLMSLWYGKESDGVVDWFDLASAVSSNPGIDALETVEAQPDSGYYTVLSPALGWLNMDFLYTWSGGNANISLISSTDDLSGVVKFIYIPSIHSVVQIYGNSAIPLPPGVPLKLVCFAQNQSGAMFSFIQDLNVSAGNTSVEVTMNPIADSALIDALSNL
jgi:hypothetical protein